VGRHPYFDRLNWVDVENREGARQAVAHLLALGHRRVATITGPLHMAVALDRRDGYKQALLEAGLAVDPALIARGDFTQEGGYRAMSQLLSLPQPPTAVFVASDAMAIGALRAAREAGRAVPGDVAVVGFDDLPSAAFASPPLSTVHQPIYDLGATAANLLADRLDGAEQSSPVHICLPTRLVVRQSCGGGPPAASDEKGG
jgi:LacI family transcriptional regulator